MFEKAIGTINAAASFRHRYDNFIGGRWSAPAGGEYFADTSPINGAQIAEFALSTPEDVERALDAAHAAKDQWARIAPAERARILNRVADRLEDNLELLALAETIDNGKPIRETRAADVPLAIDHFRYFAGCIRAEEGGISTIDADTIAYHFREPLGVVGQIIPWNFPLLMAAWKIAPALACGNTVVLKPSEFTSHTSLWLAQLGSEAGLPDGVLNVVTGTGPEVGMALVKHPDVDKISFTGSTRVGKLIQHECADSLKRVTLELGGKSPNIIFADANLKAAVRGAASGIFYNKGEVCAAGSRVLVQREIYDAFVEGLAAMAGKTTVGHPTAEGTRMGPVCNAAQYEKVLAAIEQAKSDGARLVAGGNSLRDEVGGGKGYYIEATVFADVDPDSALAQEEVFGPVVAVIPFDDEAHALEIAHNTRYGLAAGVFTRDIGRALNFAKQLRAGTVWVNTYNMYDPSMSFGGFGESGYGRELGAHALDTYTESKSIWLNLD